ncbi:MAG TPA: FAD-dependent oxidoreductase [Novosphingobium sp.]|nr:FAD-dependent oxidoreductase [Novosphingobium sp.]
MSEVLIIGGGLAGAAAALELARAGVPVRLLERDARPQHKICGEFLSIEANGDLQRLGLDPVALGAVPIDRVRLIAGGRRIEAALPFVAHGLSRKRLDEALLEAARWHGARIERGVKATGIENGQVGSSAGPCRAQAILLATGKHDIRGLRRAGPYADKDYVGFKMHWRLDPAQRAALGSAIELILFKGGYAGLQGISRDTANLCLIVRRARLVREGGRWQELLAALMRENHLARRLAGAEALLERPLTIANLPYGYLCDPASFQPRGLYRLGDQAALTAPLTGDGMAIALRSARIAAACVKAGLGPQEYHRRLLAQAAPQVRRAMFLQRAAEHPLAMQGGLALLGLWPAALGKLAGVTRLAEQRTT